MSNTIPLSPVDELARAILQGRVRLEIRPYGHPEDRWGHDVDIVVDPESAKSTD